MVDDLAVLERVPRLSSKFVRISTRGLNLGASGRTLGAGRISRRLETERPPWQGRDAISTRKTLKRGLGLIVEAAVGCDVEGC